MEDEQQKENRKKEEILINKIMKLKGEILKE